MSKVNFIWEIVLRVWKSQPHNAVDLNAPVDFVAGQVYEAIWSRTWR